MNTAFSLDNICGVIETSSGTGANQVDCCVNLDNGKLDCVPSSSITNTLINMGFVNNVNRIASSKTIDPVGRVSNISQCIY